VGYVLCFPAHHHLLGLWEGWLAGYGVIGAFNTALVLRSDWAGVVADAHKRSEKALTSSRCVHVEEGAGWRRGGGLDRPRARVCLPGASVCHPGPGRCEWAWGVGGGTGLLPVASGGLARPRVDPPTREGVVCGSVYAARV
jgi:hypothetical protein